MKSLADSLKNKWCLSKASLISLVEQSRKLDPNAVQRKDGAGFSTHTLVLRSSASETLFYEIVVCESNVWINMCVKTTDGFKRCGCVYRNGQVVRWGVWLVELLNTLPAVIERTAVAVAEGEMITLSGSQAIEEMESDESEFLIAESMLSGEFGRDVVAEVYSSNRGGIHLSDLDGLE